MKTAVGLNLIPSVVIESGRKKSSNTDQAEEDAEIAEEEEEAIGGVHASTRLPVSIFVKIEMSVLRSTTGRKRLDL